MFFKATIRLSLIQALITVFHVIFGLSLAYFFGASPEMDAYVVASNFIIYFNTLFIKAQRKTFIPFIAKYKNNSISKDIIASILRFNIGIFTVFSLLIFSFSSWIAFALAPGLSSAQHHLTSNILKILAIFILLSNFCGIITGLLEYEFKFERPAFIELITSILLIIFLFIGVHLVGVYSVPFAHIISLLIGSFLYLHFYLKGGNTFKTKLKSYNVYIKKYIYLLFPIMLASIFIWLIRFADTFIASFFNVGSISYLNYCQRIIRYVSVFSNVICIIYFPILSKLNEEKDNIEFTTVFYKGLQTLFSVTLPISLFVTLFSKPIIMILFERGNFTAADTLMVSKLLRYYFFVLLCSPMGTYLANAYFCRQNPKLATFYSIISSITNILLNCLLGFLFGIIGLAAASSIAFLVGNVLQISNIKKVNPEYRLINSIKNLAGPLFAGVFCFTLFLLLRRHIFFFIYNTHLLMSIIYLLIYFLSFFIIFFCICYFFRGSIVQEIVAKLYIKLRK